MISIVLSRNFCCHIRAEATEMEDFGARIAVQEWWGGFGFWLLIVGLIGDIAVLAVPEHRGRLEKLLSALFTVVIIVGCGFERVADSRVSNLVSQEEASAGAKIAQANNEAATANGKTADLAGKFGGLKNLVGTTETKISGEVADFQNRTAQDVQSAKQTIAGAKDTIAELNKDRADLANARNDAVSAVKEAEGVIAAEKAANEPRQLPPAIQAKITDAVRQFRGQEFQGAVASGVPDGRAMWESLFPALVSAGWTHVPPSFGFGNPPASIPIAPDNGITIFAGTDPKTYAAGKELGSVLAKETHFRIILSSGAFGEGLKRPTLLVIEIGPKPP